MRVLITGGRDFRDAPFMHRSLVTFVESLHPVTKNHLVFIHGDAPGTDQFADCIVQLLGYEPERYPANWKQLGRRAGPVRNQDMLNTGIDLVLAFPGGRGTADMVRRAQIAQVEVVEALDL